MWLHCIKMEFQKIVNFLDTLSDDKDLPRFVTKNRLKLMINLEEITMLTKKLELKHLILTLKHVKIRFMRFS